MDHPGPGKSLRRRNRSFLARVMGMINSSHLELHLPALPYPNICRDASCAQYHCRSDCRAETAESAERNAEGGLAERAGRQGQVGYSLTSSLYSDSARPALIPEHGRYCKTSYMASRSAAPKASTSGSPGSAGPHQSRTKSAAVGHRGISSWAHRSNRLPSLLSARTHPGHYQAG